MKPERFSAYYEETADAEIAIPQNIKLLAGDASATSNSAVDPNAGIQWFCEGESSNADGKDDAAFPTKTCETHLQTLLLFPNCANPKTLEYAYSGNPDWNESYGENYCPTGMYRMPRLRFSIRYDLRDLLSDGWSGQPPLELACGSSYCSHGDFINGWLPEAAQNMVDDSPGNDREFFNVKGPNDNAAVCTDAGDRDLRHGTGDYWTSVKMMPGNNTLSRRHMADHRLGRKLF